MILTITQAILILLAANLIAVGYLGSLISYNYLVSQKTGKDIVKLISNQGNISDAQRKVLIQEFAAVASHGGLATKDVQGQNQILLKEILGNVSHPR